MTAAFLTSDSSIDSSSRKNSFALSDGNYLGSLESISKLNVTSYLSISAPSNDFDQSKNDRFDTSESDRDKIKR